MARHIIGLQTASLDSSSQGDRIGRIWAIVNFGQVYYAQKLWAGFLTITEIASIFGQLFFRGLRINFDKKGLGYLHFGRFLKTKTHPVTLAAASIISETLCRPQIDFHFLLSHRVQELDTAENSRKKSEPGANPTTAAFTTTTLALEYANYVHRVFSEK
jgi:hypothetical protein